jgi:hypothetical protein
MYVNGIPYVGQFWSRVLFQEHGSGSNSTIEAFTYSYKSGDVVAMNSAITRYNASSAVKTWQ